MQSAKVIADSVAPNGIRIITLELEFWRGILAEANTHRVLSKNTSSTRAIKIANAIKQLNECHFIPKFTADQPGMVANTLLEDQDAPRDVWEEAYRSAVRSALELTRLGVAKQYAGRLLEPFQFVKAVWTGTDWANFFHLRCHSAAQPEIRELANLIKDAISKSKPAELEIRDWHVPYYKTGKWTEDSEDTLQDALDISASCCAQVSFRTMNDSIEKARAIREKLIPNDGGPVHASPMEHQATPIDYFDCVTWQEDGKTRTDGFDVYSGNFRGWIQNRHTIPENTKW